MKPDRRLFTSMLLAVLWLSAASAHAADEQGRALAERGRWKLLRAHVTPRFEKQPNDAEAQWLMSRVKLAFGDPAGALVCAEKAVQLEPRNADYHLQLAEVYGQSAQKAGMLKGLSMGKRFRKEAEAALALDPRHIDARNDLVMFHLKAPGIAGGDKKKAAVLVQEIAAIDPVEGHLARARMALERRDTVAAEKAYRQAADLGTKSYGAQMAAANFELSRHHDDLAEKRARAAMALDAGRAGPHTLLAILAAQRERWSELEAEIAAAEAIAPDNLNVWYQAGRTLVTNQKDPARAERYLRKYLTMEPEGNAPSWAGAHWRLAQALEQQGRTDVAITELQTALSLKPDLEDASKDLKRLKRGRPVANAR
jgi:tetratricopeptide (TPR) repeat protein